VTVTLTYGTASTVTPTHTQSWTVERRSST
jgi:hypothetical protein